MFDASRSAWRGAVGGAGDPSGAAYPAVGGTTDNGAVPTYRDEAIVLRTQKLGESDRIITAHTQAGQGARGRARVRKTKSKFGARLEPAMVIDVQCYEGVRSTP